MEREISPERSMNAESPQIGTPAKARLARGMSILEVTISLALLTIVLLGLISGSIIATNSAAIARRKSLMVEFAQSRMEQIITTPRANVPTASTAIPISFAAMSGTFLNSTPPPVEVNPPSGPAGFSPGTNGWMLDVMYGAPPAGAALTPCSGTTTLGTDLMAGPLLVEGDLAGIDTCATISDRTTLANAWLNSGDTTGCANSLVANNSKIFCREIHIEPYDRTTSTGTTVHMFAVYVRVIQGGGNWQNNNVVLKEDISQ